MPAYVPTYLPTDTHRHTDTRTYICRYKHTCIHISIHHALHIIQEISGLVGNIFFCNFSARRQAIASFAPCPFSCKGKGHAKGGGANIACCVIVVSMFCIGDMCGCRVDVLTCFLWIQFFFKRFFLMKPHDTSSQFQLDIQASFSDGCFTSKFISHQF